MARDIEFAEDLMGVLMHFTCYNVDNGVQYSSHLPIAVTLSASANFVLLGQGSSTSYLKAWIIRPYQPLEYDPGN
jgi:hypothetical protein